MNTMAYLFPLLLRRWKLDNINSNSIKRTRYRNQRKERINWVSNLPGGTHLICSAPLYCISLHNWPPKGICQLAVNLSTAKMSTNNLLYVSSTSFSLWSAVGIIRRVLSYSTWYKQSSIFSNCGQDNNSPLAVCSSVLKFSCLQVVFNNL